MQYKFKEKGESHGNHTHNHCFVLDLWRRWLLLEQAGSLGAKKRGKQIGSVGALIITEINANKRYKSNPNLKGEIP
jgi:hypothetical protein